MAAETTARASGGAVAFGPEKSKRRVGNPSKGAAIALLRSQWARRRIGFMASQERHPLFARSDCELVVILSRRPSLPPGELLQRHGEAINGSTAFSWIVWRRDRAGGSTRIVWAAP
jgi:hypothetical protein